MKTDNHLKRHLYRLDGKPYPAYKDLAGRFSFPDFTLVIDHVQGDPFAAPSRMRVLIPYESSGFPEKYLHIHSRMTGFCSCLADAFGQESRKTSRPRGSGKSGQIFNDAPGQEVLPSTAVQIKDGRIDARFFVGLPAAGRRILGREAALILCDYLPRIVRESLFAAGQGGEETDRWVEGSEDADDLREQLHHLGLAAFIADRALLPRMSGVDQRPLAAGTVPFLSPESLRVTLTLPNAGRVTGMGIPEGVTLIVGGGFHGKSTLLKAVERGVYNHRPGDGRELVITDPTAVKIRAEDGRSVAGVDISPFISRLPQGIDTRAFTTGNASGSTSQATGIVEALEAGSRVLLVDEDTSATNFMIRDRRMQELITKEKEPITPFVDKVRQLWTEKGVSTVLVMGGSGDYFPWADTVIAMEEFRPRDVTAQAKEVARKHGTGRAHEGGAQFGPLTDRVPQGKSLNPRKGRREKSVRSLGVRTILFGNEEIDLGAVEQIVHGGQLRAIGQALIQVRELADGNRTLKQVLDIIDRKIQEEGLDTISPLPLPDLAGFRRFELAAALNRLRTLAVLP